MSEDRLVITILGGDETDQLEGESDAAYERRMAYLREKRRRTMTQEEKDNVDEIMKDMGIVAHELGYA
ncbi:MAG: hypothetical protein FWE90_04825 [Defluviitaleaceae bacterium]|nr:hypothetical protein [Defluviitaleaceae bacterium]